MSSANCLSVSFGSVLVTLHSVPEMNAISETLDRLIEKINETVRCNFILRGCLIDDLSSFSKEKLIIWISSPTKKFQNLSANPEHHFAVPETVDRLFESLKRLIQQGEASVSNQEKYYEDCTSLVREKSARITSPAQGCDWMSLKISPSKDFMDAVSMLFSQLEVQALNANTLEQKVKQLFREMEETGTAQMICNSLVSIFGLNREWAIEIAYLLEKGNPFHLSFVDMLLNNPSDLKDRNLCFLEHGKIHTIKVEKIHVEEFSNSLKIFTLIGKNQKVVLTANRLSKLLTTVVWQTDKADNLASFIRKIDLSNVGVCEVGHPFDGAHEDWKKWLPAGEYTVEIFSREEQAASQGVAVVRPKDGTSLFWRMLGAVTSFASGRKKCFKNLYFTPTSSSPAKSSESISFDLFVDEDSKETHFIIRSGEESRECSVCFDWFCRFFPVKIREVVHMDIASHQQNEIYITQTELFTNELLIEKLKQRSVAEKAIIDYLKKIDLSPILEPLITDWSCQGDLLRKDGKVFGSLKNLFCFQELKDLVFAVCEVDDTSLESLREFDLLLGYVFQANLEQMVPDLDLSEGSDLINMLGDSLKLSEPLKNKRGVAVLGETGSGKSATTCFLIGAEMEEHVDRFGKTCVRVARPGNEDLSQLPEIGFNLGISKTTFTQGFRIMNFQEDAKIGRRITSSSKVHFPLDVDRNQFLVIDFPGFYDTRGTEYEVVTSFSIDHGISRLRILDAVVQVIPYDLLTSRKSVFFINTLRELSTRFVGAFRDPILSQRIFFLITKQDMGVGVDQLRERALELIHEERNSSLPDLEKCELLTFFVRQCQDGRVFAVTSAARLQRIDILNKILETVQQPIEKSGLKEQYQLSLESPEMKIKFTDVLNRSIGIWMDTALPQFLEHSKNKIQETQAKINEMLIRQESLAKEMRRWSQEVDTLNRENSRRQQMIETLRQKEIQLNQLSVELLKEIQEGLRGYCARIEEDIRQLRQQKQFLSDGENQLRSRLESKIQKAKHVDEEIRLKEQAITRLTTGSCRQNLHEDDYNGKSKMSIWLYRADVDLSAKRRRAIDQGTDRLSFHQDEREGEERDVNDRFISQKIANIHKDYQLLPPGQDQTNTAGLNQLIAGHKSVVLDRGNYCIEVVSNKVRFDYIRHHNDGKQVCYGYIAEFDGKPPYPNLTITHVIPNAELNRSEVARLKQGKAALEGQREALASAIPRLQSEITDVQERLTAISSALMQKENLLGSEQEAGKEQVDAIFARLKDQIKQSQKEARRLELAIKNNAAIVKKLETDLAEWNGRLKEQSFQRKRWALFIRTHASHLENAVKMAEFFISLKPARSGIDAIDAKESGIVKEAQAFLEFYQTQKDHLEEELNDSGLLARIQRP